MSLGKVGIAFDRLLVGVELRGYVTNLFVKASKVELRLVAAWIQLDLALVLVDGGAQVAALLREQSEIEVGEADVALEGDRRPDLLFRARHVSSLQRDDAERVTRGGHRWLQLQRFLEFCSRLGELAAVDEDLGGLVADLRIARIELHEPAVAHQRLVVLPS